MTVLDPETMAAVPADGETMGEIMFRGNIVMKGYLKNPKATAEAFAGGWFHTGDLAVLEPDRYVKIKDRSKDVIISGGENISSLEVEDALYRHPAVLACAVVARPDPKWGETPLAFVELQAGASVTRRGTDRSTAAGASPATRCRARSASRRSRRPRPARSRSSQCASGPRSRQRDRIEELTDDDDADRASGAAYARRARRRHAHAQPAAGRSTRSRAGCSTRCRASSMPSQRTRRRACSSWRQPARPSAPATT